MAVTIGRKSDSAKAFWNYNFFQRGSGLRLVKGCREDDCVGLMKLS